VSDETHVETQAELNERMIRLSAQENRHQVGRGNGGAAKRSHDSVTTEGSPPWGADEAEQTARHPPGEGGAVSDRKLPDLIYPETALDVVMVAETVGKLVQAGAFVLVLGPSGSGKSTLAVNMACSVAANKPFLGRGVQQGLVVYIAAEGVIGVRHRVKAWVQENMGGDPSGLALAILPCALNLFDTVAVEEFLTVILKASTDRAEPVVLIVLDTLARCFIGDENSGEDMGMAIATCDYLRHRTGAALCVVHHSGKDMTKGARGHSSLRAAVDTEITVDGLLGLRTATVSKQRELAAGDVFTFDLTPVVLMRDVSACVITHRPEIGRQAPAPKGKHQAALLAALKEWRRAHDGRDIISSIDLMAVAKEQGLPRQRRQECIEALERYGYLAPTVGGHKFLESP
jgi:energy-coupling factor transporter ATP-binding protein EcfA2